MSENQKKIITDLVDNLYEQYKDKWSKSMICLFVQNGLTQCNTAEDFRNYIYTQLDKAAV